MNTSETNKLKQKIVNFSDLNAGDIIKIESDKFIITKGSIGYVGFIIDVYRYPITSNGIRYRNEIDDNNVRITITPEDEGLPDDSMIKELEILFDYGSLKLDETDSDDFISDLQLYKLSKEHPEYNSELKKNGETLNNFFDKMKEIDDSGGEFDLNSLNSLFNFE